VGRKKPHTRHTAAEIEAIAAAHVGSWQGRPARASGAYMLRTDAGAPVLPITWRVAVGHEHLDGDSIYEVDDETGAVTLRLMGL
jgi:hypothetical protein